MPISFQMTEDGVIHNVKMVPNTRAYNREYYHAKVKRLCECEDCHKIYSSVSSLRRHRARSMKCNWLRAKLELEKLNVASSNDEPEPEN